MKKKGEISFGHILDRGKEPIFSVIRQLQLSMASARLFVGSDLYIIRSVPCSVKKLGGAKVLVSSYSKN